MISRQAMRHRRITIEPGIERSKGRYIATVTHEGKRHRQHGLLTLHAAREWRAGIKRELAASLNSKGAAA